MPLHKRQKQHHYHVPPVQAKQHAPCMRLTAEASQCSKQDIRRSLHGRSSEVEWRGERISPAKIFPRPERPLARSPALAHLLPLPLRSLCSSFARYPFSSLQFIRSEGRTDGRGRRRNDGRSRGRTRLAGKLCDTWWNRCNTLFVPRFWGISSLLVLSNLLQRFEVSSGLKFILVLFSTT